LGKVGLDVFRSYSSSLSLGSEGGENKSYRNNQHDATV